MIRKHLIIGLLVGSLCIYVLTNLVVDKRLTELRYKLDSDIEKKVTELQEIATTLGKGGANFEISALIKDCPGAVMVEYDTLLSSLDNGLSPEQLEKLYVLFSRCGDVSASRRAGMILLLDKNVEVLEQFIQQRSLLEKNYESDLVNLATWQALVQKEKESSDLIFSLVQAQEEILVALMGNAFPSSLVIENIRLRAQKLREELASTIGDASELRSSLIKS